MKFCGRCLDIFSPFLFPLVCLIVLLGIMTIKFDFVLLKFCFVFLFLNEIFFALDLIMENRWVTPDQLNCQIP